MNMNQSVLMLSKSELEGIISKVMVETFNAFAGAFEQRENKEFLDVGGAAEFLKVHTSTIYRKVQEREIPHIKKGKYLYFRKEELNTYLLNGRQKTAAEIENEIVQAFCK